jgi:hypothetical protein
MVFVMFDAGITVGASLLGWVAQATGSYPVMFLVVAGIMVLAQAVSFAWILPEYHRRIA